MSEINVVNTKPENLGHVGRVAFVHDASRPWAVVEVGATGQAFVQVLGRYATRVGALRAMRRFFHSRAVAAAKGATP